MLYFSITFRYNESILRKAVCGMKQTLQSIGKTSVFRLFAAFFIALLWCELVLRLATAERFFGVGLLYQALFCLPAALLLAVLCSLLAPRVNRIIAIVCGVAIYLLFASQLVYHAVFRTFYTVYSVGNGGQVLAFWRVIVTTIWQRLFFLLLLAVPFVAGAALCARKKTALARLDCVTGFWSVSAVFLLHGFAVLWLLAAGTGAGTPFALYFKTRVLNASVAQLGLVTTLRHDVGDLLFGFEEDTTLSLGSVTIAKTGTPEQENTQQAAETTAQPIARKPQILDVDFSALAETEPNSAVAELHAYAANAEPTYTNAKTGLFAGKNLIMIVAESFSPYCIDETLTPTLYKLQHDGFYFPNFYTGVWGVSTLDGEYVADVGLLPKQNVWSLYEAADNALPFTMGNQFLAAGAKTFAYHNGVYDYYERHISHPNLGYERYQGVNGGLTMKTQWPRSDLEMVDITTQDYINEDLFHVYYLTISGHLPYDDTDTMADKNWSAVKDLPYSTPVKRFLAANIELDKAMALLLERLEQAGRLEDTVIVLSPDHYPYGLTNAEMNELAGHTLETEFELYKSCLIVYNSGTPAETVTKRASSLDILPTLNNLFGFDYDSRLLAGRDIFSDSEGLVPFVTKSFLTDTARYNAVLNEAQALTTRGVTQEYLNETSAHVQELFRISRQILNTDYYRYLETE